LYARVGGEIASSARNDLTAKSTTCGSDGYPVLGDDKGTQSPDAPATEMNRKLAGYPFGA
jgi:hypothetical protein